jgi:uncharacterized protein YukE
MLDARGNIRRESEQRVEEAAREERAARAALDRASLRPADREWTPDEQADYDTRLARWHAASHALVAALNDLASIGKARRVS